MPYLKLFRGLPCSNKSTTAKALVEQDSDHTVRVNKDEIRRELGIVPGNFDREKEVKELERSRIQAALDQGMNLIVDNTHNSPKYEKHYRQLAQEHGYDFELIFLDVPVEECIRRDALRPDGVRVGETVIRRMWEQFYK